MKVGIPLITANNPASIPYYIKIYSSTNKIVRLIAQFSSSLTLGFNSFAPAVSSTINTTPAVLDLQSIKAMTIPSYTMGSSQVST